MWNLTEVKKPVKEGKYLCAYTGHYGKRNGEPSYSFYSYNVHNDVWYDGTGHGCVSPTAWLDVSESIPFNLSSDG